MVQSAFISLKKSKQTFNSWMIVCFSACLRAKGYKTVIPQKTAEYVWFASQVHWSNLKIYYLVVLSLLSSWWHM